MTASAAKALIQRSNRLMDDMAIMGIIGAFNTNTDVKIDSGTYAIGLSKEKCEKLKADNLFAIDLDTYQQAQKVLVSSGQLTTEQAGRDFRTQVAFLKIAESRASAIASTCNELGVHNVFPTLTPKVTP